MYLFSPMKNLITFLQKLKMNKEKNNDIDWWSNLKCVACNKILTQKPHSHCGHCKRTLCKKCGYIPGGCGWCGG